MKNRLLGLLLVGVIPLAACEAGDTGELGEAGAEEELETLPAAETTPTTQPAAEETGMMTWDTDADQQLTREEWDAWYAEDGAYEEWNTDAEEGLTSEEFAEGAFGFWDADDNDELTEAEWNEGMETWYGDEDYGAWSEWDANGDSILDANEVAEGLERENLYDTVDRDNDALIDDEELADWWFDIWDGDDSDTIDTTEWDEVGSEWSRVGTGM